MASFVFQPTARCVAGQGVQSDQGMSKISGALLF